MPTIPNLTDDAEIVDFVASHDRLPRQTTHGTEENNLAERLVRRRAMFRDGRLSARSEALLRTAPLIAAYLDVKPQTRAKRMSPAQSVEELRQFIADTGRRPHHNSDDPHELKLYQRLKQQKSAIHAGDEEALETLLRAVPLIAEYLDADLLHSSDERIEQMSAWIETNDRVPRTTSEDEVESSLAHWLSQAKHGRRKMDPAQSARLGAIPYLATFLDTNPDARIDRLAAWVATHDRRPSAKCKTDAEERHLGIWLAYTKSGRKKMSPAQAVQLRAIPHIAAFLATNRINFATDELIDRLAAWVATHDRRPAARSDDDEERRLGQFLARAKRASTKLDAAQTDRLRSIPHIAAFLDTRPVSRT